MIQVGSEGKKPKQDLGVVVLKRENVLHFNRKGAVTRTLLRTYKLLTKAAVDRFEMVGVSWVPWYMERPVLQATVTTANGRKLVLDPSTILEQTIQSKHSRILYDQRQLRAALPGLRKELARL